MCVLYYTSGLRDIVTPILAGVLDSFDRMWGFDKFFRDIEVIRRKMVRERERGEGGRESGRGREGGSKLIVFNYRF